MNKKKPITNITTTTLFADRVARIMSGGARQRFRVLLLLKKDRSIAIALNKHKYFFAAKQQIEKYRKYLKTYPVNQHGSVYADVMGKYKSTRVLIKKAKTGTGIISNNYLYELLSSAGYSNIVVKIVKGNSPINIVKAVLAGLDNTRVWTSTFVFNKRLFNTNI